MVQIGGEGILSREHRALTLGIVLATTIVAFDGLAVAAIAPTITKELGGLALYGWVFSAYLLAQIIGAVAAGQHADRHGPALSFVLALILFGVGLLVTADAPNMLALLLGRTLQGFGAGALVNCVYTSITLRYADALRPRMLAVISSAYIVPAMIGPYGAGLVAERFTWRAVFWGQVPLLLVTGLLTVPAFRGPASTQRSMGCNRLPAALQLTVGTGLILSGLGLLPRIAGFIVAGLGLLLALPALRRLLPQGILVARPGLPAALAARGLFTASYFGAESYLVLALTTVKGYAPTTAGLVVALAALTWTASAWGQTHLDKRDGGRGRPARVVAGVAVMLVGISILQVVMWVRGLVLVVALAGHMLSGLGIGLAEPSSGSIAFARAPEGEEGAVSSALQLADILTPALGIGVGGALVAISGAMGWGTRTGVIAALALNILFIVLSLTASCRLYQGASE